LHGGRGFVLRRRGSLGNLKQKQNESTFFYDHRKVFKTRY
jgi:hypothetical protein